MRFANHFQYKSYLVLTCWKSMAVMNNYSKSTTSGTLINQAVKHFHAHHYPM
jgi:hypothetical protein